MLILIINQLQYLNIWNSISINTKKNPIHSYIRFAKLSCLNSFFLKFLKASLAWAKQKRLKYFLKEHSHTFSPYVCDTIMQENLSGETQDHINKSVHPKKNSSQLCHADVIQYAAYINLNCWWLISTLHRGWKGPFNWFSKTVFK